MLEETIGLLGMALLWFVWVKANNFAKKRDFFWKKTFCSGILVNSY